MKRRHRCDVPGCDRDRQRWQRLCTRCFAALPGDIRTGLIDAWNRGDHPAHRQWKKRAAEALRHRAPGRIDARTAYERTARMMGER